MDSCLSLFRSQEADRSCGFREPVTSSSSGQEHTEAKAGRQVNMALQARISKRLDNQKPFKAGSLASSISQWRNLTSDNSVLAAVQGFRLELQTVPYQESWPKQLLTQPHEKAIASQLLQQFLAKGIIEQCAPNPRGFTSNIFLREKKNGSHRVILNLKPLNVFVKYRHFKMATLATALQLISPNCYMASIDLADAYYSVRVAPKDRKFLQFHFERRHYRFTCLANGVSSAPRTFTKLLKVPLSHLREHFNINIMAYLDDLLLLANSREQLLKDLDTTTHLLISLGFSISPAKSVILPTKQLQFLGFQLDSTTMLVTLGSGKADSIKSLIREFLQCSSTSIRHFAALLGKLAATLPGNRYGQIFLKRLEQDKAKALQYQGFNFEGTYTVTERARADLFWWLCNINSISRPIATPNPSLVIFTDASFLGWGCHLPEQKLKTGARWGPQDHGQDINFLELKAVLLPLQSCCRTVRDSHILVNSDNTTTVVGINKQGSTHSTNCNDITRQIWQWAIHSNNWLSATHCPGKFNVHADEASRLFNDSTEWTISRALFRRITQVLGTPSIDLFASYLNCRVKPYCAWQPDPGALYIDSFTIDWHAFDLLYAFPPFSVIGRMLQKISNDRASAIVIVPYWPTQPWFTRLCTMLQEPPIEIPLQPQTLHLPHDPTLQHPLVGKLTLWACRLYTECTGSKAFRPRRLK